MQRVYPRGRSIAALFFVVLLTCRALAQTPALTVHIVDQNGKPLWLARATVYGARVLVAQSARNGDAIFPNLPAGTYRMKIVRFGYLPLDVRNVTVGADSPVITVRMARQMLKQIASVSVKARTPLQPGKVTNTSVPAQTKNSLVDALGTIPGVTLGPQGQVSVDGYSPSQTTMAINGVPVSLPGSAPNAELFDADVFSSASVTPQAGGGGLVDFQTQSPTLAWQGVLRGIFASYGGEDLAVQELGTAGQVGISYTHAHHVTSDRLDGMSFLDSSGLYYPHRAASSVDANALQLRYEFSQANTLLATAVTLDSTLPMVCREFTGPVPCGYGPTNLQRAGIRSYQLHDFAEFGTTDVDATLYANSSQNAFDQSGSYVDSVPEPSNSLVDSRQNGVILRTQVKLGKRALPISFATNSVRSSTSGSAFGPLLPPVISQYSTTNFSTSLPLLTTPQFSMRADVGIDSTAVFGRRATRGHESLQMGYSASRHDTFNATFTPSRLGGPSAGYNGISPAAFLQFVCAQGVGIGTGPSEASAGSTQTGVTAGWSHTGPRWASSVSVYRNVQHNAPIGAYVNARALDPAFFDSQYLADVQNAAQTQCGGHTAPGLNDLYYRVSGIANRAVYEGAKFSGRYTLGDVSVSAGYAATHARAYGSDPLLFSSRSTAIAGRQLPNVPLHSASFAVKAALGSSAVAMVDANYLSSNNPANLPPYLTVDAGALISMKRGTMAVSVTNIGNVHSAIFAGPEGSVPLPMLQGALPTIAQPLRPRTLFVGYRFHVGPPEEGLSFSIPSAQFEPVGNTFHLYLDGSPLPKQPPANPFQVDRQSIGCGPKDVPDATALLGAWKRYADAVSEAARSGGYPAEFPGLDDGAIRFNYKRYGESFVSYLSPASGATFDDFKHQAQPLVSCLKLHSATEQEVQARHLYEFPTAYSDDQEAGLLSFLPMFSPAVGFYRGPARIKFRHEEPVPSNLHYRGTAPKAPAGRPFALNDWSACVPELRPAARDLLDAISAYAHAYFDLHQHPAQPDGIRITPHTGPKPWLSIRTQDVESLRMLTQRCMFVKMVTPSSLQILQLGGRSGELDYTPGFGLYQIF